MNDCLKDFVSGYSVEVGKKQNETKPKTLCGSKKIVFSYSLLRIMTLNLAYVYMCTYSHKNSVRES